jgi:tRNA-specific 2-thiouridylase
VLGHHGGIHRFTVGQRKGLGLSSSPTGAPLYVLALRPAERQVVVGSKALLERTALTASGVNWIVEPPVGSRRVSAQIRHRHQAAPATVRRGGGPRRGDLRDAPNRDHAGQAVVFYDDDVVVGGGWID